MPVEAAVRRDRPRPAERLPFPAGEEAAGRRPGVEPGAGQRVVVEACRFVAARRRRRADALDGRLHPRPVELEGARRRVVDQAGDETGVTLGQVLLEHALHRRGRLRPVRVDERVQLTLSGDGHQPGCQPRDRASSSR
jgi:hypothetical protein